MSQTKASALGNRNVTFECIDKDFNCAICYQVADEPTRCIGHCAGIFCNVCMQQALQLKKSCPFCNRDDITVWRDLVLRNQILKHQVFCINGAADTTTDRKRKATSADKCTWMGKYDDLKAHLNTCQYERVLCDNNGCIKSIQRREIKLHHQECVHRLLGCRYCNHAFTIVHMNTHLQQCPMVEMTCECGFDCIRDSMDQHRARDCPLVKIVCDVVGCNAMIMRRDYEKHQQEAAEHHVRLLSSEVGSMKKDIVRLLADNVNMKQVVANTSVTNARVREEFARLKQDNVRVSLDNDKLKVTVQQILESLYL